MRPEQIFHHGHLTSVLSNSLAEGECRESAEIALSLLLMGRVCGTWKHSISTSSYSRFALKTVNEALRSTDCRTREALVSQLEDHKRFPPLQKTTLDELGTWVRSVSMDSDATRVRLAASFDDIPGLTPQFLRSRVGVGAGARALRLRDMMLELAEIRPGDHVLDPCFGRGGLLISLMTGRGYPADLMVGLETCPARYLLGVARAMLCGHLPEGLFFEDPFALEIKESRHLNQYDRVLLAPRWGEKLEVQQKKNAGSTSRMENAYVQLALRALRPAGRAVIIINNGFLTNENDKKVRQRLLKEKVVAEIIQLPVGIFEPETNARASLLILEREPCRDTITFCDLSHGAWSPQEGDRSTSAEEQFVAALRAQDLGPKLAWAVPMSLACVDSRADLRVRKQETAIPPLIAKLRRGSFEVCALREVARVVSGKTVRKKEREAFPVQRDALGVLRIKDMSKGHLGHPLLYIKPKSAELLNPDQHIQVGDVLVSMKSTLGKILLVPEGRADYAVSDSLVILRPSGERLLPGYLAALLRSRSYQHWLVKQGTGSTGQKRIQAAVFQAMLIPVPPLEVQRKIASQSKADAGTLLIDIADGGRNASWREVELKSIVTTYFFIRDRPTVDQNAQLKMLCFLDDYLDRNTPKGRRRAIPEALFRGISAVLDEVGEPWCKDYAPVYTYEDTLRGAVLDFLEKRGVLEVEDYLETESPEVLSERTRKIVTSKRAIGGLTGEIRGNPQPRRSDRRTSAYERSPLVKAFVLGVAQGICEMCGEEGPFQVKGWPYRFLEIHHIQRLADGGPDTPQNAVAVCPNCHRLLHLASKREMTRARVRLFRRVARLREFAP